MVLIKENNNQDFWFTEQLSKFIPIDHISRQVIDFVEDHFDDSFDLVSDKKEGRPSYLNKTLLKILFYASVDCVTSTERIYEHLQFHQVYQFVAGGLKPSARTLRRFKKEHGYLIEKMHEDLLKTAEKEKLTDFNHISFDGTIVKANNSPYNMIRLEEIELCLNLLKLSEKEIKEYLDDKNNDKVRESVYKILIDKNKSVEDKIIFLNDLKSVLTESKQSSVGTHCKDARWMKNKKNKIELSFNVQAAVDYQSKLIVNLNAVTDPTDHKQLIPQIQKVLWTLNKYPEKISADYTYRGEKEFKFLKNNNIDGYIPNQKQTREHKGRIHTNPYHKDNFKYNSEKDTFKCPENQILEFKKEYAYDDSVHRLYYTSECKKCLKKEKCTNSETRTITEYGTILSKEMTEKMNSTEGKSEYKKRSSTVEPVFGILKLHHGLESIQQKEIDSVQTELTLMAIGYNFKRILNLKNKNKNKQANKKILKNFFTMLNEKYPNAKINKEIYLKI
ncbi:MAG: IS1182 family transposase [Methanobrevibacter sp.]|nr:IS1182 family transposase [Methanobrevibacter sp.]